MQRKRIDYIDVCSALMLLYMINVHLSDFNWCTKSTFEYLDFVMIPFMPFFFYKAGMFHRVKSSKQMINDTYRRLVVPFIVFSLIGEVIHSIRLFVEFNDLTIYSHIVIPLGTLILKGSMHGNLALWFLLTLFVVKNIYNTIAHLSVQTQTVIYATSLLLAIVFSYLNKVISPYFVPYIFANSCSGLFFYAAGHLSQTIKCRRSINVIGLFLIVIISIFYPSGCDMRSNNISGNYLVWALYSIAFIFVILSIFEKASVCNKFLCYIGRNSMCWYVLHWPLILCSRLIFLSGCGIQEGWNLRLIQTVFILFITPLLIIPIKKFFPVIIGEKR